MGIAIPLSVSADTSSASAAISKLVSDIAKLRAATRDIEGVTGGIGNAAVSSLTNFSKQPGNKTILESATGKRLSENAKAVLQGNTTALQALTVGQLEDVQKELLSASKGRGIKGEVKAELARVADQVNKTVAEIVRKAGNGILFSDVASKDDTKRIREIFDRTRMSSTGALDAVKGLSRIDKSVISNIDDLIAEAQRAVDSGDPKKATEGLKTLFSKVETGLNDYAEKQVKSALLSSGEESKKTLTAEADTPELKKAFLDVKGRLGDYTKEELENFRKNLDTIKGATSDPKLRGVIAGTQADIETALAKQASGVKETGDAAKKAGEKVSKAAKEAKETIEESVPPVVAPIPVPVSAPAETAPKKTARSVENAAAKAAINKQLEQDKSDIKVSTAQRIAEVKAAAKAAKSADDGVKEQVRGFNQIFAVEKNILKDSVAVFKQTVRTLDRPEDLANLIAGVNKAVPDFFAQISPAVNDLFSQGLKSIPQGTDLAGTLFDDIRGNAATLQPMSGAQRGMAMRDLADQKIADLRAKGVQLDLKEERSVRALYYRALREATQAYTQVADATRNFNSKVFEASRSNADALIQMGDKEGARLAARDITLARPTTSPSGEMGSEFINLSEKLKGLSTKEIPNVMKNLGFSDDDTKNVISNINKTEGKIAQLEDRQKSVLSSLAGFANKVGAVYGLLQMTIGTVVQSLTDVITKANELEKASATVAALSNNFDRYSQVLSVAITQQSKFGGSLQEQLQGFVSLVPVSKRYNLNIEQLDNIARRLAIIDPLQGFQGAAIALKEFFSGDITSLSRRFEIDRSTLNSIKAAGNQAKQLEKLDEVLASLGISQGVLTARTNTAAASFDKLGANVNNVLTIIGFGAQEYIKPWVDELNKGLGDSGRILQAMIANTEKVNAAMSDLGNLANNSKQLIYQQTYLNELTDGYITKIGDSEEAWEEAGKTIENSVTLELIKTQSELDTIIEKINEARAAAGKAPLTPPSGKDLIPFLAATNLPGFNAGAYLEQAAQSGQAGAKLNKFTTGANQKQALEPVRRGITDTLNFLLASSVENLKTGGALSLNPLLLAYKAYMSTKLAQENELMFAVAEDAMKAADFGNLQGADLEAARQKFFQNYTNQNFLTGPETGMIDQINKAYNSLDPKVAETMSANFLKANEGIEKTVKGIEKFPTAYKKVRAILEKEFLDIFKTDDPAQKAKEFDEYLELSLSYMQTEGTIDLTATIDTKSVTEQINSMMIGLNDSGVATEIWNSAVENVNKNTAELAKNMTSAYAVQYSLIPDAQTLTKEYLAQAATAAGLLQVNDNLNLSTKDRLAYLAEAEWAQAKFTIESKNSVSALQAAASYINGRSGIVVGLQQAVGLAMELSSGLQDFALNTMAGSLSISDQLAIASQRLNPTSQFGQLAPPKTQGESTQILNQIFGLESQRVSQSSDTNDKLLKLQKDHNKDMTKAKDDFDKDMKKMQEKYLADMLQLQRDSEITKRQTPLEFYKGLQDLKNLTPEQRQQYAAQMEAGRTEATNLRAQGNYTAAEGVLAGTSTTVMNQAKLANDRAQSVKDIAEAEKDIKDLEKDKRNAGDAEKAQDIEDKIKLRRQDILDYQNNIAFIDSIKEEQFNADNEIIVQARLKEETITKDYELAVAERQLAYDTSVNDMVTKYDAAVNEMITSDNRLATTAITNRKNIASVLAFTQQLEKLYSRGRPVYDTETGMSQFETDYNKLQLMKQGIIDTATDPVLKQAYIDYFNGLEGSLKAGPTQSGQTAVLDSAKAMVDHSVAMGSFAKSLDKNTVELKRRNDLDGAPKPPTPPENKVRPVQSE